MSLRGKPRGPQRVAHNAVHNSHITTVGVRRPGYAKDGRAQDIYVNFFPTTIPEDIIHHYDDFFFHNGLVVISPSEKTLPARFNMDLIKELQFNVAPQIFTPRGVYDGRKNIFAARAFNFGGADFKEFDVSLGSGGAAKRGKGPKVFKIRLTKVAEINP
ncbi:hypothetical protein H0H93_000261, partial [Arthromyces matolae]